MLRHEGRRDKSDDLAKWTKALAYLTPEAREWLLGKLNGFAALGYTFEKWAHLPLLDNGFTHWDCSYALSKGKKFRVRARTSHKNVELHLMLVTRTYTYTVAQGVFSPTEDLWIDRLADYLLLGVAGLG